MVRSSEMSNKKKSINTKILGYRFYAIPVLFLSILGLSDTSYLAYSHYKNYTDITYKSFCAISKAINCDTVSQSPWSILVGIPVSIWGIFGYLLFTLILIRTLRNTQEHRFLWNLLFIIALLYSSFAIYFGYISATKIKSYCVLCLFSYVISFSLSFFLSLIILRRFDCQPFYQGLRNSFLYILYGSNYLKYSILLMMFFFMGIKLFLPPYWEYTFPPPIHGSKMELLKMDHHG